MHSGQEAPGRIVAMRPLLLVALLLAFPAHAKTEAEWRDEICPDPLFQREVLVDGGTRADCMTSVVVAEIDFSAKWAEAIGQALLYSALTGKLPVVFLICQSRVETCEAHLGRIAAVAERWGLPLSVVRVNW